MGKLLLGEPEQKISLVLGEIRRALENPAPARRIIFVYRVMASGDTAGADRARGPEQLVELQMVVAQRAGNRRAPGKILAHKGPHHILLEALFLIHDVIRNAQMLSNASRIVYVV